VGTTRRHPGARSDANRRPVFDVDVDDNTERSKRELEVEAVAYVVGRYCELDTGGSAFYLAAWESGDAEIVRERPGRITRTAKELIDVLEDPPAR